VDLDLCVAQGAGCVLYLLYWCKSTHTDAAADSAAAYCRRYALYLFCWWKSTHTNASPPALSYLAAVDQSFK
jgi:hypothetical protein